MKGGGRGGEREREMEDGLSSVFSGLKSVTRTEKQVVISLPEVSTSGLRGRERKRQG